MRNGFLFFLVGFLSSNASEISVAERGAHHTVWQRVVQHNTPYGKTYAVTNGYQELATGKNYLKEGQWSPAVEKISVLPSGFGVAMQLQHKVIFAPNINTAGAIDCLTPDDKRLRSHVLGLAYTDKRTGQGVMIASIKDSTGVLVAENQVLYPDAFDSEGGFRVDVRYTVTLAGLEQDIILVESPPDPAIYGIDPLNCRLEVYSEFIDYVQPAKQAVVLTDESDARSRKLMVEPDLVEEKLVFGVMRMDQGAAFRFDDSDTSIPMGKTWEQREGRQLLIERADYTGIRGELARLPQVAKLNNPKKTMMVKGGGPMQASFLPKRPPNAHAAVKKLRTREMAQVTLPRKGFVLDWQLLNANTNDFTFRGDTTYYISAPVTFSGTTVFEGGTVIKGTNGNLSKRLALQGPVDCRTSPYRPAIFTGKSDDTVGEAVSGSTGNPTTNYFGVYIDLASNTNFIDLHDLRMHYCYYGIWSSIGTPTYELSHSEIGPCFAGLVVAPRLRNVLIHDAEYGIGGSSAGRAENSTFHRLNYLRSSGTIPLTNCLIAAVTNNVTFTGSNNATNASDSGVFQTAGYGLRYLANESTNRNAGTTNINPDLLAALRTRTTYPPLLLTNDITIDTTLTPYAQRDTDAIDIGYHYPVADWIVGGISVTEATLTVSGGTTVAIDAANTNWGVRLQSGGQLISVGDPVNLNRFVRTHSFQENPAGVGNATTPLFADTYPAPDSPATLNFRFTEIPQIQRYYAFRDVNQRGTLNTVILRDSQFRGGTNYFSHNVTNQFMAWTNVLFEDSGFYLYPYTPTTFHVRNCTFASSSSNFIGLYVVAGSTWSIKDSIFANVRLTNVGSGSITHDYNGYLTNASRLMPGSAHDVVLATNLVNFQAGRLGQYYLPPGSRFINAGSVNATNVGLYHFCTTTDDAPETNSIVDIGYHYVALNALGQPEDSNSPTNGVPNYTEDFNGNGIMDVGETPYTTVSISLTSPTNGANFGEGANITLSANASVSWNTMTWVEFYRDATSLGQDATLPYSVAWNSVPPGLYTLTAVGRANAGVLGTSAPVTVQVHSNNTLFIVGTSMTAIETDLKTRLDAKGLYSLVKHDDDATSADANGKRLVVISGSIDTNLLGTKFTSSSVPLFTWMDTMYGLLGMTTNAASYYGSLSDSQNGVLLPSHIIADGLTGTNDMTTTNGWTFSWGKPTTNAGRVTRLTAPGSTPDHVGIFAYESNAPMAVLKAPSRRAGFFLGAAPISGLTSNGSRLLDRTIDWVVNTNEPPLLSRLTPTNGSLFIGSTNIGLSAEVRDNDSGLSRAGFYRDGVRIGPPNALTNDAYSLTWSNVPAGTFQLTTKAIDQGGLSSTSAVAVTVLSNALFITGSPTLNPSETNLKARIESLGFIVTPKAATNVSTADALGKTVVVISSTASAADLTNRFTYVATPVVAWQKDLFDDLGLTGTNVSDVGTSSSQTQLSMITNHALAAGLSGTVTVTTAANSYAWGVPGSNAIRVATLIGDSGKFPIFGYEKGAIMAGVGTNTLAAPARRIGFMLTSDTAISLNANGWALFDAAILWAITKPCPTNIDLMLAMDVSKSLSAADFLRSQISASNFINFLRPPDRVGLVSFASNSILESALTTNLASVQAAIMGLGIRDGTLLEPPVTMCQSNLASSPVGSLRLLALLSDGIINQQPTNTHRTNALVAAKAAKDGGTRIVTIGYGTNSTGIELLNGMASSSADFYYSPEIADIEDVYGIIADTVCRFDKPPSVTITNPANNATFLPLASIPIDAIATDEHGFVAQIQFFEGTNSLGLDFSSPWSFTWTNVLTGHYTLTAVAMDNAGLLSTSAPVNIKVTNFPPIVTITAPTNGSFFAIPPATVTLSATATDSDGYITNFVFFVGSTPINLPVTTNGNVYSVNWWPLLGGTNVITARAVDNMGGTTTSDPITFFVNNPPFVAITNPVNPAIFMTPNNTVIIQASASDVEASGSVTQVEFFRDDVSLGVASAAPYSRTWTNAPPGMYVLAAKATDNNGAMRTSTGVTVTVRPTNSPPSVEAGPTQIVRLPAVATLNGRAIDDGLPPGSDLQIWWSKVSGPGTVTFSNSTVAATTANFTAPGTHILRLTATDGQFTVASNVSVEVQDSNVAPTVNPGFDRTLVLAAQAPLLSSSNASVSQFTLDSKGREFWLAFTENYRDGELYSDALSLTLFVTGDKNSWIRIAAQSINFVTNVNLIARNVAIIDLPKEVEMRTANGTNDLGIHILSQEEVSVYGLTRRSATTDAFLGLPVDVLGTNYLILNYTNQSYYSQFAVLGTRKNTSITITPAADTPFAAAGETFTIALNAGQGFFMQEWGSLTGSSVVSDKPVAVFAGNFCTTIYGSSCNHLVEQLMPLSTWGKRFVTMPLALRTNGDIFRIIASENDTDVETNAVTLVSGLNRGHFVDFPLDHPAHITASKPIALAQFARSFFSGGYPGDPFMQLIPPYEQFLSDYTLTTSGIGFSNHFISIVCPTGIVDQVKLNGANLSVTNFVTINSSGFAGANVEVTNGSHVLTAAGPFGAVVYGFGDADAYGYLGGLSLSSIGKAGSITFAYNPDTNQCGVTRCLFAHVSDMAGHPLSGIRVDFDVVGTNLQSGFAFTDIYGTARYCYFGGSIGRDIVEASVGSITAKATNYWVQPFVRLAGSISDDGLPSGLLTNVWEQVGGPGSVGFRPGNTATNAEVTIPQPGVYVLSLKAGDGGLVSSSNMTITAIRNEPPLVDAGASQAFKGQTLTLNGTATDDGLPSTPLIVNWAALAPPGAVTFSSTSQPQTSVSFSAPGIYHLQLTADDGDVAISSDVVITNIPETIPLVCDQTISGALSAIDRDSIARPGIHADFYRFTASEAGAIIVVEMASTNVDAFLSLYSKDLQLIANDDDSLQTNNAKLICMLPYAGEYILEASSSFTNQTGGYSVHLGCGTLPYVRITSPANGAVFTNLPVTITITADAYHVHGIDLVDFYVNGDSIGSVWDAPYEAEHYISEPGIHKFVAIATNGFNAATSSVVVVRAVVPPLLLTPSLGCPRLPGAQHTVTATLRDDSGAPLIGTNIQFTVSGANTASGSQTTDASGEAVFTYTGTNVGFDVITASAIVSGGTTTASAGKTWARPLLCSQTTTGALASADEILYPYVTYGDYFWFYVVSNDYVVISVASTNFDTYLSVYNETCTLLSSNDDYNDSDSKLGLTITNTGLFFVEVTSFHPLESGGYSLFMECIAPAAQSEIAVFTGATEVPNHGLVEFGMTTNGTPIYKMLTITNRGDRQLIVENVSLLGDFSSTNATNFVVAPASASDFIIKFKAATNGLHSSFVAFYSDDGDRENGFERPFIINLTAICNTGSPPTVTLTAPANNTVLQLPTNILVTATASSGVSSVTNVEFIARKDDRLYVIGSDSSSPYEMTFYPLAGSYVLTAVARDAQGRIGISTGVNVEVKAASTNAPPVAVQDYVSVLANSAYNVFFPLENDTDIESDPLTITSVYDLHGGYAEVINNRQNILYIPPFGIRGGDYFRYTISDGKGQASSVVNVRIEATAAPTVRIITPPQNAGLIAGTPTNILAQVTPSDFHGKVEFFFHDHKIGEVSDDPYTVSWIPIEDPCNCGLLAVATDVFGQIATSEPVSVNIQAPTNGAPAPVARIANLTNQIVSIDGHTYSRAATIREGLFEVFGDAYITNASPARYKLRIFNSERELVRDVTPPPVDGEGFRSGPVTNASLGVIDLTLVENGAYDLELTVRAGYRQTSTNVRFALESDLKIGHFSFSEQDLVLPANGFPLTITRTYNSLNLKKGDFGRSWTFTFSDPQLELDEERGLVESLYEDEGDKTVHPSGQFFSLRVGGERNVTLTLPDGRRTTFYYYLHPVSCDTSKFKFCALPSWQAGPGVFATLRTINDVKLAVLPWSGGELKWWTDDASSDPEAYEFPGYILTMQDGTEFRIERESLGEKTFVSGTPLGNYAHIYGAARLTEIKSRNNDRIAIGTNRIDHLNPSGQLTRSIWMQRDEENRIVAINDPIAGSNGVPVVKYDYAGENLIRVHRLVDRATSNYLTTTYTYTNRNYPHYITGITDPRGIRVAKNLYDTDGRLVGIINADGLTNSFVHNLSNRWEIALNPKGHGTTNVFDLRGNITNRIDALGRTNHFRYDTNGLMLAHIDPLGNTTTYSNDARGNVLEVTLPYPSGADPAKYTSRYTYDENDNQTSVVLPTGGVITNRFDSFGNLLETRDGAGNIISTNAYDANGFMIAEGDQFGALKFGHDSSGNATRMTNSLNQVITSGYNANGDITNLVENGVTSSFSYDGQGRDAFANYGNGITLSNGYNSQMDWNSVDGPTIGHMERRFDNQGRLSGWTTVNGAQPGFAYNEVGQMEYETNSIRVVTRQVYDVAGRLIAVTNLTTGAGAAYAYDAAGHRVAETNALGHATRFDYNPDGSLKAMTNAFGTNVWTYAYDTGGGCCGGAGGATTTVTDPLGREVMDIRSPLGLPLQLITKFGTNAVTNTTVYLSGIVSSDQEGEEYPASITDEGGRTRNFGYTSIGQLYRATDLSGTWYTNEHDLDSGQLTNVLGPTGESLSHVYDNLGNLKATRFGDGNWLTNYYSAENNVASNTLPSGISVHHQYDVAGRITNYISTMGEVASLAYNGNDAVTSFSDNTGGTTNLYDPAGRLIGIDYPTGANVRYELDKFDRIMAITNRASGGGMPYITRFGYDAIGNVTNMTDPFGGQTSLEYDLIGRRAKRTLPNGVTTQWQYNWRDQITNVIHKNSGGTVLASAAYERALFGEPTKITREDNSFVVLKYDTALRLTNEQHCASGGGLVETIGYGYDASGTRVRLSNAGGIFTNSVLPGYQITAIKRQSDGATVETYGYDSGGRITAFSRAGNTLNLGYNTADQLASATNGAAWVQYQHDATGRRVRAADQGGVQRRFLVAPSSGTDLETCQLVADENNNLKQGYVFLGDQPLLRFDATGVASRVYYLEDAMGSVIGLAPNDSPGLGNTPRLFYTGFGTTRSTNGPSPSIPSGTGGDYRFHRAWWETSTDLYHMRARDYDAHAGRFLSRDPRNGAFRRPETLQPYVYALNNPQIYRDPSGEFTVLEVAVVTSGQIADKLGRVIGGQLAKKQVRKQIGKIIKNELENQVKALLPGFDISPTFTGSEFGKTARDAFRQLICRELALPESIFVEVPITVEGLPVRNGFTCNDAVTEADLFDLSKLGVPRPDFIIGSKPPKVAGGYSKTWLIGEFKGTTGILYRSYFKPATDMNQYVATLNYAKKHTYTHTALFIVAKREKGSHNNLMKEIMAKDALKFKVIPYIIIIIGR